jgi:hypothetical protein
MAFVVSACAYAGDAGVEVQVYYQYTWDPDGFKIEPLEIEGKEAPDLPKPPPTPPVDAKAAEEEAKSKEEQIAFYESCIVIIQKNMEKDKEELARTSDATRRGDLLNRVLVAQANIQSEMDRINTVKTGEIVHTRTAWDEMQHAIFVNNCQEEVNRFAKADRYWDGMQRMIGKLPPDEAEKMRAFVFRHTDAKTLGQADNVKLKKLSHIVYEKVQAGLEAKAARSQEEAIDADWNLAFVENVKKTCDYSMMALSLGGGHGVMVAYEGAIGFIEGPPPQPSKAGPDGVMKDPTLDQRTLEGLKRGLSWFSTATYVAVEALEGYNKGGYIGGDLNKGSAWGAIERAGEAFLVAKAIEYGVGKVFGTPPREGLPPKKPTVKEAFELANHKQAMEEAKVLVNDYQRTYKEYQRVLEFGGSAAEIAAMEKELARKAASMHSTIEAKTVLKKMDAAGESQEMVQDFIFRVSKNQDAAEDPFRRIMKEKHGYDNPDAWILKDFRNSSSAGTVGMDHDIGVLDKGMIFTRNGTRVSARTMNEDARKAWNEAYHQTTGYSAERSWETFTTSKHAAAYSDLAWLGNASVKGVKVNEIIGSKAAQAGDVTAFKAQEMLDDKRLTRLQAMTEASRGMGKDIETKLLPVLEGGAGKSPKLADRIRGFVDPKTGQKVAGTLDHWKNVRDVLKSAADNPIEADRAMRQLTGKSIPEIVNDLRDMIAIYGKFVGK